MFVAEILDGFMMLRYILSARGVIKTSLNLQNNFSMGKFKDLPGELTYYTSLNPLRTINVTQDKLYKFGFSMILSCSLREQDCGIGGL